MIQFTVLGNPVGKSRPKFSTFNGHAVAYTPAKTVSYENLVKLSFQQQCNCKPYDKDVQLAAKIIAYFPIPKSVSKKARQKMIDKEIKHTKRPDVDNLIKAILDALNGIAYYDDSQICEIMCGKYYGEEPKVQVQIWSL